MAQHAQGFVLVIDNSIYNISRDVRPSTLLCSAHRFPITIDQQLALSIRKTTEDIFKGVIVQKFMPTKDQLENLNCNLVLLVKLKRFDSNLRFFPGFWSSEAVATCNLELEITAKNSNNNILITTTVKGNGTIDRNAGSFCGGGAIVLGEAVNRTIEEIMERYAERISNSRVIRDSLAGQSHM